MAKKVSTSSPSQSLLTIDGPDIVVPGWGSDIIWKVNMEQAAEDGINVIPVKTGKGCKFFAEKRALGIQKVPDTFNPESEILISPRNNDETP